MKKSACKIMGILNATPDSFSGDGVLSGAFALDAALKKVEYFIASGADIIDIGGESTRPTNALPISLEEELNRVLPVVEAIRQRFDIPLSIDTFKAPVARQALERGVTMVNDVTGMTADCDMPGVVSAFSAPVVLMHSHFSKDLNQLDHTASKSPHYDEQIVSVIFEALKNLAVQALSQGVKPAQIILDPGVGFGKSSLENLALIKHLGIFKQLGYPLLLGVSRKTFIGHFTGAVPTERLPGSLGMAAIGIMNGADFIRVHDVAETRQVVQLVQAMEAV